MFFRFEERTTVICSKSFAYKQYANPLQATGEGWREVNSTPHRAHLSRHTLALSICIHLIDTGVAWRIMPTELRVRSPSRPGGAGAVEYAVCPDSP